MVISRDWIVFSIVKAKKRKKIREIRNQEKNAKVLPDEVTMVIIKMRRRRRIRVMIPNYQDGYQDFVTGNLNVKHNFPPMLKENLNPWQRIT